MNDAATSGDTEPKANGGSLTEKNAAADLSVFRPEDSPTTPSSKTVTEAPKEVSTNRKVRLLVSVARFHLPSLCFTVFITVLYARNSLWPGNGAAVPPHAYDPTLTHVFATRLGDGPTANHIAALQFAAKLNEGLVVISLSNILFHRVRYLMLQSDGVPLGLLASSFQLSNLLNFFNPEILGTAKNAISTTSTL